MVLFLLFGMKHYPVDIELDSFHPNILLAILSNIFTENVCIMVYAD